MILDPTYKTEPGRSIEDFQLTRLNDHALTIKLDYINSFPLHNEEIWIDFVCDGEIGPLEVSGGGAGWSVRHIPLGLTFQIGARYFLAGFMIGLIGLVILLANLIIAGINNPVAQQSFKVLWGEPGVRFGLISFSLSLLLVFVVGLFGQAKARVRVYRNFALTVLYFFKWVVSVAKEQWAGTSR